MDEKDFKNRYKQAYDRIVPGEECIDRILEESGKKAWVRRIFAAAGTGMAAVAAICLLVLISLPVMVKAAPSLYEMVVRYVPSLADYCLPVEYSCTSQGIVMQVEAVNMEGNSAEILVSFSDEEGGGDLIHGPVMLIGGYGMKSYGSESSIGGCSFLEYDEAADKAYVKVDLTAFEKMDKAKTVLTVYRLMADITEEEQWISMDDMVNDPKTREVTLNSRGGSSEGFDYFSEKDAFGKTDASPDDGLRRITTQVMDVKKADAELADKLTVMGIGYLDGVLRVQICRGNLDEADRHARLYLVDSKGEELIENFSVGWSENAEGVRLVFTEHWFIIDESELKNLRLYGIFCRSEGLVEGEWEVTLEIE